MSTSCSVPPGTRLRRSAPLICHHRDESRTAHSVACVPIMNAAPAPARPPRILATNDKNQNELWARHVEFLPGWLEEARRRPRPTGLAALWRDLRLAARLYRMSREYDVVITGSDRAAMTFGILQRLLRRRKKPHIVLFAFWNLPAA